MLRRLGDDYPVSLCETQGQRDYSYSGLNETYAHETALLYHSFFISGFVTKSELYERTFNDTRTRAMCALSDTIARAMSFLRTV